MRVRPLIDCIMSEIEPFLFSDLGVNIDSINHYLSVLLEAGRLGAFATEHVPSRPAVPDLCIASSSLLSVLDPLPLDRLSRHTVDEISLWPAADRHAILAVANRDVRVARQNIAEMMLYVDDHAAHLANCASANDDSLTLMSTELIPRLEGGIRAVLDEAANL